MGEHTVRILTDDGWEELGKDRYAGVPPSPPQAQSDPGGFAGCSFTIPRPDPGIPHPDLSSFAECEIDVDGLRVFEGRVSEAPVSGSERTISVQGRGWQYALDENPIPVFFASTELDEWKDARDFVGARIYNDAGGAAGVPGSAITGGGTVSAGDGQIMIGHAKGDVWPAGGVVGVTRDFGPNPEHWPKSMTFSAEKVGSPANVRIRARIHDHAGDFDNPRPPDGFEDGFFTQPTLSAAPTGKQPYRCRWPFIRRYVTIYLVNEGAEYTPTADDVVKLSNIIVYNAEHYENSYAAGLRASSILAQGFRDTPGVVAPLVRTPEFAPEAASWKPLVWFRGRAADVTGLTTENYSLRANSTPTSFGNAGPLPAGQPSFYAAFDGVNDGLEVAVESMNDITLAILFRTSQAAPAGAYPAGRGLFDLTTATAGDNDWGLQIVAGGRLAAGVRGAASCRRRKSSTTANGMSRFSAGAGAIARGRKLTRRSTRYGSTARARANTPRLQRQQRPTRGSFPGCSGSPAPRPARSPRST
jgi:hypothetical protein